MHGLLQIVDKKKQELQCTFEYCNIRAYTIICDSFVRNFPFSQNIGRTVSSFSRDKINFVRRNQQKPFFTRICVSFRMVYIQLLLNLRLYFPLFFFFSLFFLFPFIACQALACYDGAFLKVRKCECRCPSGLWYDFIAEKCQGEPQDITFEII